ncbi:YncE family protein [Tenacibaculum sp. SDUM215027]|uniref:YncE family protein n=1 Tax=Tenacibaculum sp. SDUM215027 TaxID=3422596 RepID=UPI003D30F1E1
MKITKLLGVLFLGSILFTSCSDDRSPSLPKGDYENGILISGEGNRSISGSVSFVSNDLTTVENTIYKKVNNAEFGEYVQSIAFDNDRAYIVTDNQNTVTVVDRYTFDKAGTITTGLSKPRYMTVVGNKGYVTNWGATDNDSDDFVAIVDLNSLEVEGKVDVALGPERIIAKNGKLYVSHLGAFGTNNKVVVIDIATKSVVKEVTVKDRPDELYIDSSGKLVVLSQGKTIYDANGDVVGHTLAAISFINTSNNEVESELTFNEGEHPSQMVLEGNDIYYSLGNDIYKTDVNANSLPTTEFLATDSAILYGLAVRDNEVFVLDANFLGNSKLDVYDLSGKTKKDTKEVALGASKIYFN